ncbi:DUF4012 domain-containing protein, partial [Candidatus Gottesmanbacteria bacterium]|nr:DUF4012 domain-containing protein [Candidatus Gottesmanbacteria bacterium]
MIKQEVPSRVNAQLSDLPIARLDAQDLEQSLPLREYLEQNGCAVVVGRRSSLPETYHIICGDADFVKETIASMTQKTVEPFVVLMLGSKGISPEFHHTIRAKIAVVTGTTLSARDIPQLFAYFITSDAEIFYLDNSVTPMMELKPVEAEREEPHFAKATWGKKEISPVVEESLMGDEDRVSRVIGEMFGKEEKMKTVHTLRQKRLNLKTHTILKGLLFTFCIIAAPTLWYLVSLSMIALAQWYGVGAILRGDVSRTEIVAGVTTYWVGQGKGVLTLIGLPVNVIGGGTMIRSQERVLSVTRDIVVAEQKYAELIRESHHVAPLLLARENEGDGSEVSLPVTIDRMRLSLDGFTNALGLAGAQLHIVTTDSQFPFTIPIVKNIVLRGEEGIASSLTHAGALRNVLALYRAAGGFDGKKTYLILLQNSMELRPTGGFIGSIATVTAADGMIATPVVQDVYALDGQLKGHVDPPGPIKELLQQEHWYLRDSNWDPDFAVSGARAAWFYEKETGQTVDGVIAIATPFLTDLLGVIGPLDLPDYNDRITKDNFFGKSLFYTKADFFPGSTQKKDFLGSLMVALMGRLTSGNQGDIPALAGVVGNALTRGDIQFWFPEREVASIAEQAGWAGEVNRPVPCESLSPPCMVNRVTLVESNMGVNKVNSFIKRSVKQREDVSEDGAVEGKISLTYHNTSTDDSAVSGGGVYLVYLRALLPADALVISSTIDGVEIPGKAVKA